MSKKKNSNEEHTINITKDYSVEFEPVAKNAFAQFIRDKRKEYNEDNGEEIDRFKVVRFDNERYLKKMGESMYATNDIAGPAHIAEGNERPRFLQGYTETSNVNVVNEMVQMIEVNRAYEANQKTIQSEDSMMSTLWQKVAVLQ